MRKQTIFLALAAVMLLGLGGVSPAFADAAPPQNPPGSSVSSGKFDTKVQMVAESVLMTIDDYVPGDAHQLDMQPPFVRGQVDATFIMQNQGDVTESFDVWFPIGVANGYGSIAAVDHFRAWVDGVEAAHIGRQETRDDYDYHIPWATWPASFPSGKPVTLRVTYDTYATGYPPYGRLEYILATGAGWYGSIGEGTVTFRLPYDVTEMNAAVKGGRTYWLPTGGPFTVSGTDVVWHFTNLEPTTANNVSLVVLAPATWRKIAAAQELAAANPGSVKAQLALAETAQEGLSFHNDALSKTGGSMKLVDLAADAYEAAIRLDPNNLSIYIDCLVLLDNSREYYLEGVDPRFAPLLDRALQIAPDNTQLIDLKNSLAQHIDQSTEGAQLAPTWTREAQISLTGYAKFQATANVDATAAEALRLTPLPPSTSTTTPEPAESATEMATTISTPAPSPSPASIPTPTAIPDGAPGSVQEWTPVILGVVVAAIIGWVWVRRRAK